ncbi:MAG: addiction module protein [Chlorobium sp.]
MRIQEILDLAMTLKPVERLLIIDGLLRSLDEPDHNIDELWAVEAENRLNAYREGRGDYSKTVDWRKANWCSRQSSFYEIESISSSSNCWLYSSA